MVPPRLSLVVLGVRDPLTRGQETKNKERQIRMDERCLPRAAVRLSALELRWYTRLEISKQNLAIELSVHFHEMKSTGTISTIRHRPRDSNVYASQLELGTTPLFTMVKGRGYVRNIVFPLSHPRSSHLLVATGQIAAEWRGSHNAVGECGVATLAAETYGLRDIPERPPRETI